MSSDAFGADDSALTQLGAFAQAMLARDFSQRLEAEKFSNAALRELASKLNSLSDEMDLMVRSYKKIEKDIRTKTAVPVVVAPSSSQPAQQSFAAVEIGAWSWDSDGNLDLDSTCLALFGLPSSTFQGKPQSWLASIEENDRQNLIETIEKLHTAGSGSMAIQLRVNHPNGTMHHLAMKATMISATRLQGAVWDVSAEASALVILNRLRLSLDASAIVATTDPSGHIKSANDKFCEISGYSREELLGKNHRILNSGYHPKEFFAEMWRTIREGNVWHGVICNRRKNGDHYWVDSTIIPFKNSAGQIEEYFSIRFDFTERKNMEKQLVYAAKMSSLGEMAGSIVHEINNPLAIIQGKSRQIMRALDAEPSDPAFVRKHAEAIEATTERIVKIMRGIRAFSRDGTQGPMELEKLAKIVKDILAMSSARFTSNGVELRCAEIASDIQMVCRPVQIGQVILNLLNNAFDAIQGTDGCWVSLDVVDDKDFVEIHVTDSGKGISEEVAKKIFQPFFTTKAAGQGTGLGLGIATSIVQAHGGTLKLDASCANTRFVARFPKAQINSQTKSA